MEELLGRPHRPRFQLQDINVESLFESFAHVHTGFLQAYPCRIVHMHASIHASKCAGVYANSHTRTGMPEASWPQGIGGPWSERFSGYASLVACQPQEAKEVAEGNAQSLSSRQPRGGQRLARESTVSASPSTAEYVLHIEDVVPAIESFQVPCTGAGASKEQVGPRLRSRRPGCLFLKTMQESCGDCCGSSRRIRTIPRWSACSASAALWSKSTYTSLPNMMRRQRSCS